MLFISPKKKKKKTQLVLVDHFLKNGSLTTFSLNPPHPQLLTLISKMNQKATSCPSTTCHHYREYPYVLTNLLLLEKPPLLSPTLLTTHTLQLVSRSLQKVPKKCSKKCLSQNPKLGVTPKHFLWQKFDIYFLKLEYVN